MIPFSRAARFAFAFLSAFLVVGCSGIQIIPEPFVMPDPGTRRFQLHAQVVNFNSTTSPFIIWMKLHAEYWPAPPAPGQPPCVFDSVESLGFLASGQNFKLGPEDVSGHQPGNLEQCLCLQFQCEGSIDLTLLGGNTPQSRVQLEGPHTAYNFTWIQSGDPDDPHELIRDFSIVPSH